MIPGEYMLGSGDIRCNAGKETTSIRVTNTGDRPVQIGSHYHFYEVNKQLLFNREQAFGKRLNIAAGTAVRFEPGEEKQVELVQYGGNKFVVGFHNLVNGSVAEGPSPETIQRRKQEQYKSTTHEPEH